MTAKKTPAAPAEPGLLEAMAEVENLKKTLAEEKTAREKAESLTQAYKETLEEVEFAAMEDRKALEEDRKALGEDRKALEAPAKESPVVPDGKGATHLTVMSALPHPHEFDLPGGHVLVVLGRPESRFVGGNGLPLRGNQYGETRGVKASDWEYVMEKYGSLVFLQNEVMFATGSPEEKDARLRENADLKSGLEQVDPEKHTLTKPKPEKDED